MKPENFYVSKKPIINLIFISYIAFSPAAFFALLAMTIYSYTSLELISTFSAGLYIWLIISGWAFVHSQEGDKIRRKHAKIASIASSVLVAMAGFWIYIVTRIHVTMISSAIIFLAIPALAIFCSIKVDR